MKLSVLSLDDYLQPYSSCIESRHQRAKDWIARIDKELGGFESFTQSYKTFGLQVLDNGDIEYKEWAPSVQKASLIGDFNFWNEEANPMTKDQFGIWHVTVPADSAGNPSIAHDSKIKILLFTESGEKLYRMPAWIQRATQDMEVSPAFESRFWNPKETYKFKNSRPEKPLNPKIYEAHVGIATESLGVGTYRSFADDILPRIKKLGYNCIQLMGIKEHAYYASFGYQVTNFFAVSSRFGTPDDLKYLVDTAHGLGLYVLLDLVHSHASKNILDGINYFDGTDHQYFHGGSRGYHESWDSRLFNYANVEVLRFLLSNIRWWLDEFMFDGFRFDAVSSMLYKHHGNFYSFSGNYSDYFGQEADEEAIDYLILANIVVHKFYNDQCITIAEDVSGMPTLCIPYNAGGIGFDYRLAMAIPDMWIKLLKHVRDEDWNMGNICFILSNRRWGEKTVSYCESHDQALVGDKTIAFWLMDKEMYTNMSTLTEQTPIIARGLALHKMIRLITHALGGEAYMNFMGNEFGHPEWLDFPREGNNNSYQFARRQWNLVDDELLRYKFFNRFDEAMNKAEEKYQWLISNDSYISWKHEHDKVIVFERGVSRPNDYQIVLNSDSSEFGGFDRVNDKMRYPSMSEPYAGRQHRLSLYLPCRTALVLYNCTA